MTWSECVPDRFYFSHGGSGVFLCYYTTCSCTSPLFQTPSLHSFLFAFLLCNKFSTDCSHLLFPSPFSRCFPHFIHLRRASLFLASVHLAVTPTEGPACAWAHNKIIFALGCWNSADTPWQFHLPWERGKKGKSGTDVLSVPFTVYCCSHIAVVISCIREMLVERPHETD